MQWHKSRLQHTQLGEKKSYLKPLGHTSKIQQITVIVFFYSASGQTHCVSKL